MGTGNFASHIFTGLEAYFKLGIKVLVLEKINNLTTFTAYVSNYNSAMYGQ